MVFKDNQVIDEVEIIARIPVNSSPGIDSQLRTDADDFRIITRTGEGVFGHQSTEFRTEHTQVPVWPPTGNEICFF